MPATSHVRGSGRAPRPSSNRLNGASTIRNLRATIAIANAIANPMPTAFAVSTMCWTSAGWRTGLQFCVNQSLQNRSLWTTQLEPSPKFGMTVPPPLIAPRAAG
jgi:hypothetical protein